jgi:integrase
MARAFETWSDEEFERRKRTPGKHHDGGGLYLDVRPKGGAYWYIRYSFGGKPTHWNIGPVHSVTLRQARKRAAEARAKVACGKSPKAERDAERAAIRLAAAKQITFTETVDALYAAKRSGWRSEKHAYEWRQTLRVYAEPKLGNLAVGSIGTGLTLQILEPLWRTRTVSAGRLRQRLESVFDYAKARQWREGENPARWRGHLEHLLPRVRDVAPVKHHKALPFGAMADFMADLRQVESVIAECLAFIALTAVRTSEAREATWDEIAGNIWTIPKERTKRFRVLRVALSPAALAVLERRRKQSPKGFIFPGRDGALGDTVVGELMESLRPSYTVHGLRSTFADWASEAGGFPREWVEAALGHKVGSETETAYRRGDFLQSRFRLMTAWAAFCAGEIGEVIALDERRLSA